MLQCPIYVIIIVSRKHNTSTCTQMQYSRPISLLYTTVPYFPTHSYLRSIYFLGWSKYMYDNESYILFHSSLFNHPHLTAPQSLRAILIFPYTVNPLNFVRLILCEFRDVVKNRKIKWHSSRPTTAFFEKWKYLYF